jgi:hypothetical protein
MRGKLFERRQKYGRLVRKLIRRSTAAYRELFANRQKLDRAAAIDGLVKDVVRSRPMASRPDLLSF